MNRKAPGPPAHWLWGHIPEFKRDVLGLLMRSVAAYGDVVRFRLGRHVIHLVNHPEHVAHVLQRHQQNYNRETGSVAKLRRICGESLLTTSGETWRRERRLVQPAFHPGRMASFAGLMTTAAGEMLDGWEKRASQGPLDVASEMAHLAFTIAGRALFGAEVGAHAKVIESALGIVLAQTFRRLGRLIDPPLWVPSFENRQFLRALATIDEVVLRIIEARRGSEGERDDVLSLLWRARDDETGAGLSVGELRNEVITLLLAGHETTANAMAWALFALSRHPEVEEDVRAELAGNLGGRQPGLDDLSGLTRLNAALDETLRLYPPIWIIERRALDADEIGGYVIPAGSLVVVSPFSLHRHPAFWPEPEKFDPARFGSTPGPGRTAGAYLPFGAGPHQCIGSHFALLEARLVLSMVLQRFRLRLVPGHVVAPEPGITLRLRHGLLMTLAK